MNSDPRLHVLNVQRLPARLKVEDVSALLGCSLDDLRILARAGLLRPLGSPVPQNATKFYAAIEIQALMQDRAFLDKMTRAILRQHRTKNARQSMTAAVAEDAESGEPSRN